MSDKSIVLVGAGAVGSLLAAALAQNGREFTWVVRNPVRRSHFETLPVQFPEGSLEFSLEQCHVVTGIEEAGNPARIVIAVKSHQVDSVISRLNRDQEESALVVANGLHRGSYHLGLLYGGAFLKSNVLVAGTDNELLIGNLGNGAGLAKEFASLLDCRLISARTASNDSSSTEGIRYAMWMKMAVNCIVNPLTALLDVDNGDLLGRLHGPLAIRLAEEIAAVIKHESKGRFPAPSTTDILSSVKEVLKATRTNSSSMREDVRHGRETEIRSLNLALSAAGKRAGIDCFANLAVGEMISLLSSKQGYGADRTQGA